MKRGLPLLLAGIAVYAVLLVLTMPAAQVYGRLAGLEPAVVLHGLSGTMRAGTAASVQYQALRLGPLEWRLRPAGLLRGRLEFRLTLGDELARGEAIAGAGRGGRWWLYDVALQARVAPLVAALATWPVEAEGRGLVVLDETRLRGGALEGVRGMVRWEQARLHSPLEVDLGTVELHLEPAAEGGAAGRLTGSGGALDMDGELTLGAEGAWRMHLGLRPAGTPEPALVEALELLGRPDRQGRYRLETSGRLPISR